MDRQNTQESHGTHRITVCTSCRQKGTQTRPGFELIEKLRVALNGAQGGALNGALNGADHPRQERFDVTGVACMAGCERPCTVAYHGPRKATYLFGDIDPASDVADLVRFAHQYASLSDGWCSSVDRPGKLRSATLARVPALDAAPQSQRQRAS